MENVPNNEGKYYEDLQKFVIESKAETWKKVMTFPKYIDRQHLSVFLARYEIFKKIVNIHGSVIEFGTWGGNALMTWAQCSAILEPYNYVRKIIGFNLSPRKYQDSELHELIALYDRNRPIGHVKKVEVLEGSATTILPKYIKGNPHLIVSLLHIDYDLLLPDFDLYEPTVAAIKHFVPLMPKGGIIMFDELNSPRRKGESMAVAEKLGISSLKLERIPFEPKFSYAVIE
ncbi:MAG: class I SAM-dependent methyltransferase [Candidatus Omnitrophica bacterium]|nr:class I SAM-dependent methyltransferase [Candidatus Omnitrophota bacterium]